MLGESWKLELKKNVDILKSIDKNGIKVVGFKAEIDKEKAKENALAQLTNKGVDAVCLNILNDEKSFGTDDNAIEFITHNGSTLLPKADKLSLSFEILSNAKEL